jgi:signal peptidase I
VSVVGTSGRTSGILGELAESDLVVVLRRLGKPVRLLEIAVLWVLLGLAGGILLATTAPHLVGYRSLTVLSGSMEPALGTGDIVFGEQISAREAKTGDVITFREPGETRLVTHRLVSVRRGKAKLHMVTKGDANRVVERWSIPADGSIARAVYRVPKLGYGLAEIRSPRARLLLVVIPALLLALNELILIWRPRRKRIHHEIHV